MLMNLSQRQKHERERESRCARGGARRRRQAAGQSTGAQHDGTSSPRARERQVEATLGLLALSLSQELNSSIALGCRRC